MPSAAPGRQAACLAMISLKDGASAFSFAEKISAAAGAAISSDSSHASSAATQMPGQSSRFTATVTSVSTPIAARRVRAASTAAHIPWYG